jgi:hypothetical protein
MRWDSGITIHQSEDLPLKMCRQGRPKNFIQLPSCQLEKTVNRSLIGPNGRFFLKLAVGKKSYEQVEDFVSRQKLALKKI